MSKVTHNYEGVILFHADANEETMKEFFRKNKKIIQDYDGEISNLDTWGKRKLANPINKETSANFFHILFKANNAAVAELERTMRINEKVLRFMFIRLDDRVDLKSHASKYKETLNVSNQRIKEMEQKQQKRFAERAEKAALN